MLILSRRLFSDQSGGEGQPESVTSCQKTIRMNSEEEVSFIQSFLGEVSQLILNSDKVALTGKDLLISNFDY